MFPSNELSNFYRRVPVAQDWAILYFRRDRPCFQFTGFQPQDHATKQHVTTLLEAVVALADQADLLTQRLSDHYPAKHNLTNQSVLKQAGVIRVPLDENDLRVWITLTGNNAIIPAVWFNEGQTNAHWNKFEAALKAVLTYMR